MTAWSHTTASRLSISEITHRKTQSHVLYSHTDSFRPTKVIKKPLPHALRSVKGLLAILCVVTFIGIGAVSTWKARAALKQARWEAQLAEHALTDSEIKLATTQQPKWLAVWTSPSSAQAVVKPHTAPAAAPTVNEYDANGLYKIHSTSGKHPILELIEKGERDWKDLKARQSKNLTDVVTEYKQRYKRNPPIGFDAWWRYSQENGILLPDEYNQIDRDLAPYRALDPDDLRHRAKAMQERGGTFTLVIRDGQVNIEGPFAHIRRAKDVADLVQRFAHNLPLPVNMTFIIDDSPAVLVPHEAKARMMEMASTGEHFSASDYFEDPNQLSISNYARACPADSPLRKQELNITEVTPASGKSFIWHQTKANDLCNHPEIKPLHGHTQTRGTEVTPLVPLFSWAKMRTHSDILVTPLEQYWDSYIGDDPDWSKKSKSKLLWRGSTTGADFTANAPWKESQRARLHIMSREKNSTREVLWADENDEAQIGNFDVGKMNDMYMDTSFSGQPAQCDPETCEYMRTQMNFAGLQGLDESYQYKYMIDVDGNAWSGRFHRLMSTKSLVMKTTVFPEWYADRLIPWYHFVPVKVDYSDLYDIMAFFVGTPDGKGAHDRIANRLAENGRHWAGRYWRRVDMASYMYRLVLEYARLLHDGEEVDYVPTMI